MPVKLPIVSLLRELNKIFQLNFGERKYLCAVRSIMLRVTYLIVLHLITKYLVMIIFCLMEIQ